MGPTASGKTELAEALADRLDAQLINADAFQVYRGLDIGTAKPANRDRYALIDIKNPDESYGLGEFVLNVQERLKALHASNRSVILVGGTGLYIRAVFEQYANLAPAPDPELREELSTQPLEALVVRLQRVDPASAARIDLRNPARVQRALERALVPAPALSVVFPPFRRLKLACVPPQAELAGRIENRVDAMMQNGWVDEVAQLCASGYRPEDPGLRALGYRTLWRHLEGEVDLGEARATTIAETRRYAKRQRTWLRSEPNLVELDWTAPLTDARHYLNL
jgi:tRNA dimethylallyltransferase